MSAEGLARLEAAYQQALVRMASGREMATETRWLRLPGLSAGDVAALAADLSRTGVPARQAAARLAAAFIDQYVLLAGGDLPADPVDIEAAVAKVRGGASWDDILDPAVVRARELADRSTLAEALRETGPTVGQLADQDVLLAAREGTVAAAERHNISRWARRPEPTACQFCRQAAEQRYYTPDLRPIHGHCHCITVPILDGSAPPGATTSARRGRRTVTALLDI